MSANLQFVPGDFRTYVAAQKFHLGKVEADIAKGAILQFDGATLRFAGKEYTYPELRSAIKASWLVEGEAVGSVSPPAPVAATAPKSVAEAKAAIPAPAATKYAVDREQDVAATFPNRNKQAVSADTPKAFNPTVLREDEGDNRNVGPAVRSAGSKIGNDIG